MEEDAKEEEEENVNLMLSKRISIKMKWKDYINLKYIFKDKYCTLFKHLLKITLTFSE